MDSKIKELITGYLTSNDIVLFMKGDKNFPQCGFSSYVVQILSKLALEFKDVNVLLNNDLREGIKLYADWPTIPQLYVKGEFIGGCDIVKEMYQNNELQTLVKDCKKL